MASKYPLEHLSRHIRSIVEQAGNKAEAESLLELVRNFGLERVSVALDKLVPHDYGYNGRYDHCRRCGAERFESESSYTNCQGSEE